ncbi:MAG TPA: DUF3313 domain-containing protein [Candidatus Omnitrophota bacterium]|nr:DUF3313 domain-containing protein [Candidatus Omnitrophota bacterium]
MEKRFLSQKKFWLIHVMAALFLAGCATKQLKLTETGFLSSYADLQADKESKGMYVFINPNVQIAENYDKIVIAPVQFELDPTVKQHAMTDEDQKKLADYFVGKLKERLAKNYTVTDQPGEGALLFRTAITDVLPNKVYLNLHWSTTLLGGGIGGAALEAELVDSITGDRIISFVDARKGRKLNYTKGLTKWGHTQEVLGIWADLMVENLDRLKEKDREGSL